MLFYLIRRVLLFVPTILLVMVLIFALSRMIPGDPVLSVNEEEFNQGEVSEATLLRMYRSRAARMGLDLPSFFFSLQPAAYPDTLYKIPFRDRRRILTTVLQQQGNWPAVETYFSRISALKTAFQTLPADWSSEERSQMGSLINDLQVNSDLKLAATQLHQCRALAARDSVLRQYTQPALHQLELAYTNLIEQPKRMALYWPKLVWHGVHNQFTHLFKGYLRGDLGQSYHDGQPVGTSIWRALKWTLLMNSIALPLAYLLAIALGVQMALRQHSRFDRYLSSFLFGLYAMPIFWVALLLLTLFTNPDWGMNFIRITGISNLDEQSSWSTWINTCTRQMIVPVFCLIYPNAATLTRQMRSAMIVALNQDFVRTARAKGLPESKVVWRHAFPNAAFPLVTTLGNLIPEIVVGSILLENLFNIPGMGSLLIAAISREDWPLVFGIVLLSASLSVLTLLLVDVIYARLDPRVRFNPNPNATT